MVRLRSVGRYAVEDQTIGKGNFAVVELATHTITKTKVALKVIDKRKITKHYVKKNLTREARIMSLLRHPNIARLYETIVSPTLYCLIMEYVPGGDLLNFVRVQRGGRLKEGVARKFVRQLVSALHHMHELGIVHRDLKMENIMLDKRRENIKIIDFGLGNQAGPDQLYKTHCGSPEYAAPELYVAGRDYGPEVDIWSLGVNIFAMITGKLPFTTPHSENRRQHLLQQIRKGLKGVRDKEMEHLTDDCKDLLHGCIEPVPEDRLPLFDIENHAWITCEGQEPFCPFQPPPQDLQLRAQVIEEMALRLKVSPEKIQDVVKEEGLDDVSAIFNIMLDEHLTQRGVWGGDHTRLVRRTPPGSARPRTGRRSGSRASSTRPESPDTDTTDGVRTPTVVSMVRPSLRYSKGKNSKTVDFELDVVEMEEPTLLDKDGLQSALPPPWAKKNRPLGNATTVNSMKARSYKNGTPGPTLTSSDYDHEYNYAHTDLLEASTIHILVPTPSFESQPNSQADVADSDPIDETKIRRRRKLRSRRNSSPNGGKAKTRKPVTNVRVSFLQSPTKKGARGESPAPRGSIASSGSDQQTGKIPKEVKVLDMSPCLNNKQTYHGYRAEETSIAAPGNDAGCMKPRGNPDSRKSISKEVRLCVAHREFLKDARAPTVGRPAATPYTSRRSRTADNELELSSKPYSTENQSANATDRPAESPSPSTTKRYTPCHRSGYITNSSGRRSVDSTNSTASSSTVISQRSILHPSIACVHGKKETAAILTQLATFRCSDGRDVKFQKPKPRKPQKKGQTKKQTEGKVETKKEGPNSGGAGVCRRTTMEFTTKEVRGKKFSVFNGMPQRAQYKRCIRRTPHHSPKPAAPVQYRDARSAGADARSVGVNTRVGVNARVLKTDDSPSKFIQKFGAKRSSPCNKDGHRYCRVPSFGYSSDRFSGRSPSPTRHQSPVSKSASPLRRVVDISEQAMNSLVPETIREKRTKDEPCGDMVKTVQRHYNERLLTQRKSPAHEMYARFVPIQMCGQSGQEKGTIRPNSSPAPRANPPNETVFNILDTIPYGFQPPACSNPAVDKNIQPTTGTGGVTMATKQQERKAVSADEVRHQAINRNKEWDATYRLERKVSDTVKGATYVSRMKNDQRTRAWVADMATEFTDRNNCGQ